METYTRRVAQEKYAAGIEEQRVLNYNRAIHLYSEAIELNKEVPEYYAQRGLARFEQSDFNLALQDAQRSILIDESYREGYKLIIKCYVALGDVAHATEKLEAFLDVCGATMPPQLPEVAQLNDLMRLLADYKKDFELKEYDSCLAIMTKAIRISPGALNFQLRRSECMLGKKHFTAAVNLAQKIVSLGCFNAETYYVLGLVFYHMDMPDMATKSLECCLRNDQEYGKAKLLRALIIDIIAEKGRANNFFKEGKYQEALSVYQNILKLEITDNDEVVSKMWYNCALMLSKLNNTEDAIKYCSKALIRNPKYYKAFSTRAECHFKLFNYDECVRDCISAYDIEKTDHVETLFNQSLKKSSVRLMKDHSTEQVITSVKVLFNAGKYTEAIDKLSAAIKICPMNIKFYEYRIECAMTSENFDSALRDLDLLTLISNNSDAHMLIRVKCLLLKGDLDEAKKHILDVYKTGHTIAEEYELFDAAVCKALILRKHFEEKRYEAFISLWDIFCKSFNIKYLGISYKLMRAECLYNLCDYDKSTKILDKIIESDTSNARAIYLKGLVSYQMMKFNEAVEQFNECLIYESKNDEAQSMLRRATELQSKYSLGLQLYHTKYFEHANMAFAEMLKLLDNINDRNIYYSVLYEQAKCLLECGKYDDCINNCMQIPKNMNYTHVESLLDSAQAKWKTTRNTLKEGILISRDAEIERNQGQLYYNKQDYKNASASFSEAIAITSKYSQSMVMNSKFLEDHLSVARCFMKMGDLFQTESILHRMEELKLVDSAANTEIQNYRKLENSVKNAIKSFNESDYHQCLLYISNALKMAGASEDFKMISAECSVWLGEYDKALLILESLDSSRDDGYIRGMIAYLQNDLDGAMNHLKRCVKSDNGHDSAKRLISNSQLFKKRIQRGNELMGNEKFEDAIIIFTEAMTVDKNNSVTKSELHLKCAECNKKLGYRKECINECNLALGLNPYLDKAKEMRDQCQGELYEIGNEKLVNQNAVKHIQNGDEYKASGYLDKSIESYTKAIKLQPHNVTYCAKRADCYFLMGDLESTLRDARAATTIDVTFIRGHILEAKCSILKGDTENERKILAKLEKVMNIETERRQIQDLAEICSSFKNMEFDNCIHQINEATESSLHYQIMKVECLIRLFKLREAENIMSSLKHPHMEFLRGLLCYYKDNYAEAVGYFKKYTNQYKDEEVQKFLKISNKIIEIKRKEWKVNPLHDHNPSILQKLNKEIQKYKSYKLDQSETLMRLYYQRAFINNELKKSDDAIADCKQALHIDPNYQNALDLQKIILGNANHNYYGKFN